MFLSRIYIVLFAGGVVNDLPKALSTLGEEEDEEGHQIKFVKNKQHFGKYHSKKRVSVKSRQWIVEKKEHQRVRGDNVRPTTKYTGRPRKRF